MNTAGDRYDTIGQGYARTRREDPRLRARIVSALGDAGQSLTWARRARTSRTIATSLPSSRATSWLHSGPRRGCPRSAPADVLPLRDGAVDAAMAVLTLHHWDDACERGVREMRRVARGRVVIVTYDPRVSGAMWLMAEYLPEVATLDHRIFPTPERLAEWLGGRVAVEPLPIHRDSPDWMLGSFWAHPERVLDAEARAATSGFARMPAAVVDRVVAAIARDLADGSWDRRHGAVRARGVRRGPPPHRRHALSAPAAGGTTSRSASLRSAASHA